MLRFFRNIRQSLLIDKKPTSTAGRLCRYLLYAIGEILLVVIGILIALQINNWNTQRINNQSEIQVYRNIKLQIVDDMNEIIKVKDLNSHHKTQFEYANRIITSKDRSKIDTLAFITMNLSQYSDFHRSSNIYETLVNSGDLKLLKNANISSSLQKLEMTYTHVNKLEDIHWEIIMKELSPELRGVINYSNFQIVKPDKLYSVEIQNIFLECIYLTIGKDFIYNKALGEIETIIKLIDEELNYYKE